VSRETAVADADHLESTGLLVLNLNTTRPRRSMICEAFSVGIDDFGDGFGNRSLRRGSPHQYIKTFFPDFENKHPVAV